MQRSGFPFRRATLPSLLPPAPTRKHFLDPAPRPPLAKSRLVCTLSTLARQALLTSHTARIIPSPPPQVLSSYRLARSRVPTQNYGVPAENGGRWPITQGPATTSSRPQRRSGSGAQALPAAARRR